MDKKIMIISGEASGDVHGSLLATELWKACPGLTVLGIGGQKMEEAGVNLVYNSATWGVVGITGALKLIPRLYVAMNRLEKYILSENISCIIYIDFGAFNIRLAKRLEGKGIASVYYFPPSPWSDNVDKAKKVASLVHVVCATFPRSYKTYIKAGAPVKYVGHPVLDRALNAPEKHVARQMLELDFHEAPTKPEKLTKGPSPCQPEKLTKGPSPCQHDAHHQPMVVALMPGSRAQEIKMLLPAMLGACKVMSEMASKDGIEIKYVLPVARKHLEALVKYIVAKFDVCVKLVEGDSFTVIKAADLLVSGAGTATLEGAVLGTPLICIVKLSPVDYWFLRKTEKNNIPEYVSLPNEILKKGIVPEFVQDDVNGRSLGQEAYSLLMDKDKRKNMLYEFEHLKGKLGTPPVTEKVAQAVLDLCKKG